MSGRIKTLTLRLPLDLYGMSRRMAEGRRVSLNALVREGLDRIAKEAEYARLYEAFGQLGEDAEACDVEFAVPAQWEAIRRGEPTPGGRQPRLRAQPRP